MKMMVPVGVPEPGGTAETVAVKVTNWPYTEGLELESSVVVVFALFTVWRSGLKGLKLKLSSPPYSAVMVWMPTVRLSVLMVACPEPSRVLIPSIVAPSMKVTFPVGVPAPGGTAETVAVKVTD